MDLEKLGKVAGIAGIGVGAVTLIFRDIVAKEVFSSLPPDLTYQLLQLIVILGFVIGLVGLVGWFWQQHVDRTAPLPEGIPKRTSTRKHIKEYGPVSADVEAAAAVLQCVDLLRSEIRLYGSTSLKQYVENPSQEHRKLVDMDFRRIMRAADAAKDAIAAFDALKGGEDRRFWGILSILRERELFAIHVTTMREPTNEVVALSYETLNTIVKRLDAELQLVKGMSSQLPATQG